MTKDDWIAAEDGKWFDAKIGGGTLRAIRLGPLVAVLMQDVSSFAFADLSGAPPSGDVPLTPLQHQLVHGKTEFRQIEVERMMLDYASKVKKAANDLYRAVLASSKKPKN